MTRFADAVIRPCVKGPEMTVTEPSDREQIYDLMVRYGQANDTRDVDLLHTCFTDDVVAEYPFSGTVEGLGELAATWRRGVAPISTTHHFTNFTFAVDGHTALSIVWSSGDPAVLSHLGSPAQEEHPYEEGIG
jgi:ketosteroid isomerase-like protein